jgi:hypothetical protein
MVRRFRQAQRSRHARRPTSRVLAACACAHAVIVAIDAYQKRQHAAALRVVAAADGSDGSSATLRDLFSRHADDVVAELWQLSDELMFKYADGSA